MQARTFISRVLVSTLLVASLLVSSPNPARALTVGWNLVRISYCYGSQSNGIDFLYVFPTTGGALFVTDAITLNAAAQFCANGNAFYAFVDGNGLVSAVTLYPGFK